MQEELADIWKENIIEDLESGNLSYATIGEFLSDLKQEFGGEDNKMIKVTKLKKDKQESKTMKKFIQKFRRMARKSEYEERLLVKEFK